MEVTFETDKKDYAAYIAWFCIYKNLEWRLFISLLIAFFIGLSGSGKIITYQFFIIALIAWLIMFVIGACVPLFINLRKFNWKIKELNFPVKTTIAVSSEGLSLENFESKYFIKWDEIKLLKNSPKYIYIEANSSPFLIPKRYFDPDEASSAFFNKIQLHIKS